MRGPMLSYDERVGYALQDAMRMPDDEPLTENESRLLAELFKRGGYENAVRWITRLVRGRSDRDREGFPVPLLLRDSETELLKALLSQHEGCINALTETTEKGKRLSKLGVELAAGLLQRTTPTPFMPWPILKVIWDLRLIRMNPAEAWIFDEETFRTTGTLRVLLSQRPMNDPYFPRQWHNPGAYVGGGRVVDEEVIGAETVAEAYERVVAKETGARLKSFTVISIGDFVNLSRDPELSVISLVTLDNEPKLSDTIRWYVANELPEHMMEHSRAMLEQRVIPWVQLVMIDVPKMHPDAMKALYRMVALMQPLVMPTTETK